MRSVKAIIIVCCVKSICNDWFLNIPDYLTIYIHLQLGTRTTRIILCLGIDIIHSVTLGAACRSISSNRMALVVSNSFQHSSILFSQFELLDRTSSDRC